MGAAGNISISVKYDKFWKFVHWFEVMPYSKRIEIVLSSAQMRHEAKTELKKQSRWNRWEIQFEKIENRQEEDAINVRLMELQRIYFQWAKLFELYRNFAFMNFQCETICLSSLTINNAALIEFHELVKLSNDSLLQMHELWRDNTCDGWVGRRRRREQHLEQFSFVFCLYMKIDLVNCFNGSILRRLRCQMMRLFYSLRRTRVAKQTAGRSVALGIVQ